MKSVLLFNHVSLTCFTNALCNIRIGVSSEETRMEPTDDLMLSVYTHVMK